jgi:uncharacterized protein (DUF2336 family)
MSVQAIRPQLTEQDIHRLMKGETPEQRASVAHRLCRRIALDVLSEDERKYAEEIMAILADDAADLVRRTLSVTLRNSPILPREIALKLAQDIEAVAIPVLQDSPVFTEEDLIELVLSVTAAKQAAIAARDNISVTLTEVISEHGQVDAVRALASNSHAEFTDRAYDDTLRRFGSDEIVQKGLIRREFIPTHIAEKMVSLVSGQLFDMLVNRHELPAQMAIDLAAGRAGAGDDRSCRTGWTLKRSRAVRLAAEPEWPPQPLADHACALLRADAVRGACAGGAVGRCPPARLADDP